MDKICLIKQPAGLGDIFFSQKIAKKLLDEKTVSKVIWPVIKEYTYISNYLIDTRIEYVNQENDFPYKNMYLSNNKNIIENKELLFIPLQTADSVIRDCPILQAKYKLCDIDYKDWKDYFEFERNYEREYYLENYIKIKEPFTLINNNFGSKDYAYLKNNRGISIKGNVIYMDYLGFDNIFDWLGIIEGASEIHTVDTVWCYLMTKMNIKNVTVYSRKKDPLFFNYVNDIFNPKWEYIL